MKNTFSIAYVIIVVAGGSLIWWGVGGIFIEIYARRKKTMRNLNEK